MTIYGYVYYSPSPDHIEIELHTSLPHDSIRGKEQAIVKEIRPIPYLLILSPWSDFAFHEYLAISKAKNNIHTYYKLFSQETKVTRGSNELWTCFHSTLFTKKVTFHKKKVSLTAVLLRKGKCLKLAAFA